MNSDGTDLHRVADQVGYLVTWSRDSKALVFGRLIALENPNDPQIPLRTEIYRVTTDGAEQKILLADDTAYGIQPLGWSTDGQQFYYARITLQGQWEIWGVDALSGLAQFQTSVPAQYLVQSASLSPDGADILFAVLEKHQYALFMLSVDGRKQRIIVSGATGDQPINRYAAIWSPDGQSILTHIPPQAGQPGRLERINLSSGERRTIPTDSIGGDEFLIPRSWSPDGEWLVVLKYPRPESLAYLMQAIGGPLVQVSLTPSSDWITLLGWAD